MSASSGNFATEFDRYKDDIAHATNERQRAQYFIEFLRRLPELDDDIADKIGYPTDIRPELEEYISTTHRQQNRTLADFSDDDTPPEGSEAETVFVDVSGRLDARVGNLVIEFKDNLSADRENAEEQLQRYVYLLHEEEGIEEDFLCMATDGESFVTYETLLSEDLATEDDVGLSQLTEIDTESADISEVERWIRTLFTDRVQPIVEELDTVFGVDSSTFEDSLEILQTAYEESQSAEVHREEWANYLQYAQGESPEEEVALFLRHTYLASFAKMLSYMVFTRGSMPSIDDAKEVLSGEISAPFPDNLFEEDLFAWIGRTDVGDEFVEILIDRLLQFNLGRVDQDVFKKLYQDMISYEVRHDLGEYYTPDWLAEYIVREKLAFDPDDSVLDPGCGSGTFLVEAIKYKRERSGLHAEELVTSVPSEVTGIDVHPLAVEVAKANYVAAIRDLLPYRREQIQIPIFLADSVLFDEELEEADDIEGTELGGVTVRGPIEISEEEYYLPDDAVQEPAKLDRTLDLLRENLNNEQSFENRLLDEIPEFEPLLPVFDRIRKDIATAASDDRDSIHAFILKNFFRPLYLRDSAAFDVLIGNPPWLSYNFMNDQQQDQLRSLIHRYNLHPGAANVSNMELATLFIVRCMDLYLRDSGELGYVMPRAIFTGSQHDPLRRGEATVPINLDMVLDLEDVTPLFNVPTASVIAHKEGETAYPVPKETLSGTLPEKNADLATALDVLDIDPGEIFLHGNGTTTWDEVPEMRQSPYYDDVYEGTHITPRPLWFAELQEEASEFGFDASRPSLINSEYAVSSTKRKEYETRIEADVEADFIYSTLIGSDLVPFAHKLYRRAVLPIVSDTTNYNMITAADARSGGTTGLADWLEQSEEMWSRTESRIDTIYQRLDYHGDITRQNPSTRYRVLSPSNGTNVVSCVVDTDESNGSSLPSNGFIAEHKTKYYETDDEDEAYYLVAVLNSNIINDSIKNLQSRGDFGPRDIHKLPYQFPIPRFDADDPAHERLVELGRVAEEEAEKALVEAMEEYSHIGYIRRWVREEVEEEIAEIDEIVERLLQPEQ